MEQSFKKNKPYVRNLIDNLKVSGHWKLYLTKEIDFMLSQDRDEEQLMHSKTDNIESMIDNKTNEIIKELFQSFFHMYKIKV